MPLLGLQGQTGVSQVKVTEEGHSKQMEEFSKVRGVKMHDKIRQTEHSG